MPSTASPGLFVTDETLYKVELKEEGNFLPPFFHCELASKLTAIHHAFHLAFATRKMIGLDNQHVRMQSQGLAKIFGDGCLQQTNGFTPLAMKRFMVSSALELSADFLSFPRKNE